MRVFISYSHEDARTLKRLRAHLAALERGGVVSIWHDLDLPAGHSFPEEVKTRLNECELFVALMSPGFLRSRYCHEQEVETALRRQQSDGLPVALVVLEPCNWRASVLGHCPALPHNGKPLSEWSDFGDALFRVADELSSLIYLPRTARSMGKPNTAVTALTSNMTSPALRWSFTTAARDECTGQEFLADVHRTLQSYAGTSMTTPKIVADLARACAHAWRRRTGSSALIASDCRAPKPTARLFPVPSLAHANANLDLQRQIAEAFSLLPPTERETLLMHLTGLSSTEIATSTQMPESVVRHRLTASRVRLMRALYRHRAVPAG